MIQDTQIADRMRWALNQSETRRPRNQQVTLGPSSLGGCREYIRATLADDPRQEGRTDRGLDGAMVGTILGEGLEVVMGNELGMRTQVPTSTYFEDLALTVAGSSDLVDENLNWVGDLKSVNGLAEVRRVGPSLKYLIQVSVYTLGLIQGGYLTEGATASLVYYDRSGSDKEFLVFTITWDEVLAYVAAAEQRLLDVFQALDAGSPEEMRWALRDEEPGFCHFIGCPFRMNCWGGSEWVPSGTIESADGLAAVASYIEARTAGKDAEAWKKSAREGLRPYSGIASLPDGKWAISWKGSEGRERLDVLPL